MDSNNQNYSREPWDDGTYGNGRTQPPKSYVGIIALLLVIVIFLSGIVSGLGILNIRLFRKLRQTNAVPESAPMSFAVENIAVLEVPEETEDALLVTPHPEDSLSMTLNPSPEAIENIPQEGGLSWQEIYEKNIPSVVSISVTSNRSSATGTGVVLSNDGYIVTNAHVIEPAGDITVLLTDERTFTAHLVGADPVSDLAVLHIDATGLVSAEFGDSGAVRVGDAVAAIGDPLGVELRGSMTDGIISAINRNVSLSGRNLTLLQTNAALNSGNSGGPLVNCYGQVIGINTMKISSFADNSGVEGLGFAIPSATVKEIVEQLIHQGYVSGRPSIGLTVTPISRFDQYYYRLPSGVYIEAVDPSSNAAEKGIEEGDVLVSIDGESATTQKLLDTLIYAHNVGDTVEAVIFRNGTLYRVDLTLGEFKG